MHGREDVCMHAVLAAPSDSGTTYQTIAVVCKRSPIHRRCQLHRSLHRSCGQPVVGVELVCVCACVAFPPSRPISTLLGDWVAVRLSWPRQTRLCSTNNMPPPSKKQGKKKSGVGGGSAAAAAAAGGSGSGALQVRTACARKGCKNDGTKCCSGCKQVRTCERARVNTLLLPRA
jgi:hypothetical protein